MSHEDVQRHTATTSTAGLRCEKLSFQFGKLGFELAWQKNEHVIDGNRVAEANLNESW